MSRSPQSHPTRWLLILLVLWLPFASRAATAAPLVQQPWTQCLETEARGIGIHPQLLQAIVHVESRAQPYAFGWTDSRGARHTWTATTSEDATLFLHRLLKTQHNFDAGLAQINVQNIPRLTKQLGIHPLQILDPCTNLTLSAIILKEAVTKHGYTWRAIAAYNGSTDYIPLVWTHLCRVHRYPDCPATGTLAARAHPPVPTDPLRLTRATSIAFNSEQPEFPPLAEPTSIPPTRLRPVSHEPRSIGSVSIPSFNTVDLPTLLVTGLVPFSLLIATIVVLSIGIRIILWALRGVRISYRLFTASQSHTRAPVASAPYERTAAPPLGLRSPRS